MINIYRAHIPAPITETTFKEHTYKKTYTRTCYTGRHKRESKRYFNRQCLTLKTVKKSPGVALDGSGSDVDNVDGGSVEW